MENLRRAALNCAAVLSGAVVAAYAMTAVAQSTSDGCGSPKVIPLTASEPAAKLVIHPPQPGPLAARGVAIIEYCAQNLHVVPVFGANALDVSPRVGHVHVRLDDASWVWADASGDPVILMGLRPGPHKVAIELNDANHHALDEGTVSFVVPEQSAAK